MTSSRRTAAVGVDAPSSESALLSLQGVCLSFGGIDVLHDVDLAVPAGRIFGLVGPNGAGKTSLFNCVSGHYRAESGQILLGGVDLRGLRQYDLVDVGLARTFQHPELQLDESVLANVLVGAHSHLPGGALRWGMRWPGTRSLERAARTRAMEVLGVVGLADVADRAAQQLPHGLHKRVELARALMSEPRLLLLDEPAGGLPHHEVEALIDLIQAVRAQFDLTILLVEHHMGLIASLTDQVAVLVQGRNLTQGTAAEVSVHPDVVAAYLGGVSA